MRSAKLRMWVVDNFMAQHPHNGSVITAGSNKQVCERNKEGWHQRGLWWLRSKHWELIITQKSSKLVLIKTNGNWQVARLSSECLGRTLGLVLPFQLPTWTQNKSSVSPTKSRAMSHHQTGSGVAQGLISCCKNEFVLSVLSELIPWGVVQRAVLHEQGWTHQGVCDHLWCLHSKAAVTSLLVAALSSGVDVGICATSCHAVKFSIWRSNSESA